MQRCSHSGTCTCPHRDLADMAACPVRLESRTQPGSRSVRRTQLMYVLGAHPGQAESTMVMHATLPSQQQCNLYCTTATTCQSLAMSAHACLVSVQHTPNLVELATAPLQLGMFRCAGTRFRGSAVCQEQTWG